MIRSVVLATGMMAGVILILGLIYWWVWFTVEQSWGLAVALAPAVVLLWSMLVVLFYRGML